MASEPIEGVRRAYGIGRNRGRQLQYKTGWLHDETAQRAASQVDTYNFFEGAAAADAIRSIAGKDPNARFSFGRESSPVLYVETRKPRVALGVLGNMHGMSGPDELGKVTHERNRDRHPEKRSGHAVVRAWWD